MRTNKRAERILTDADKFPSESVRERLARRFGIDAVALSGPCEGQPIVKCICDQLEKRWDKIKDRFAGTNKTIKLAFNLAESYMRKDDTDDAIKDIQRLGFNKKAATGIAGYLKAFALDEAADDEFDQVVEDVDNSEESLDDADGASDDNPFGNEESADVGDDIPADDVSDGGSEDGAVEEDFGGGDVGPEDASIEDVGSPDLDNPMLDGIASIDGPSSDTVTIELPKDVASEIAHSIIDGVGGAGEEEDGIGADVGEFDLPTENLEIEVIDEPTAFDAEPESEIPGEPIDEQGPEGEQVVTNDAPSEETSEAPVEDSPTDDSLTDDVSEKSPEETADEDFKSKMASMHLNLRSVVAESTTKKASDSVLKLGPEMSINNTDQIGPHKNKELGKAKEKAVGEAKPLDQQVKPEGYTAGGDKFQDKKTMKAEEKFDPKTVDKSSLSGGDKSIMGKNESYPDKGPSVPAGSAPIGGEKFDGGNLDTKGTVIATITSSGIEVEVNGKKYMGKSAKIASLSRARKEKVAIAIGKIEFNGDGKAFTLAALRVIAKECADCPKTDTSKLEDQHFTNDGEKKPDEGTKSKATKTKSEEQKTCDNGKLEAEKFTNDGEKKPEGEGKKKASTNVKKTAGEKAVEAPKPLDENVKPEGYTAGGNKFQDGSTLKNEEKFTAEEVKESDVSSLESSLIGKDESYAKDGPKVPAGGPSLGKEEQKGGDVSTTKGQGSVVADQSQKSQVVAEMQTKLNDTKVREERYKAASVYVADMLRHGEISETEFTKELEKVASLPVPAIQSLIVSTKKARERVASAAAARSTIDAKQSAGLGIPLVINASTNETDHERLVKSIVSKMKLTRDMDRADAMPEKIR